MAAEREPDTKFHTESHSSSNNSHFAFSSDEEGEDEDEDDDDDDEEEEEDYRTASETSIRLHQQQASEDICDWGKLSVSEWREVYGIVWMQGCR